ncbi:uncharacterized protein LOC124419228 [Lucilia cuprina]|uniref:uncharacterized protein LOC124419228 n=1 Tax=Lucilia cuprina TaxID=7375 RepID=UPI001F066537|nr:uncharacterized protein LOC124419228 [Lucilia cuprina]
MRYYAKVSFLEFEEYGLLDTGANISCIGAELAKYNFSKFLNFNRCKSYVKTADGKSQSVVGWLDADISFKNTTKPLKLFIIPSISQRLILGLDFWRLFNLCPDFIGSPNVIALNSSTNSPCELHSMTDVLADFAKSNSPVDENFYPLTNEQKRQLDSIISLFPNFDKQGLGKTKLIEHKIDVGNATPVKQRFYPVSPAVEKLMFGEVDRMLALGVIEPSSSPWSSPMRLVVKPNKVRLCLDARKLNQVTKKDAYPLPNIGGIFARLPKANLITKLDLKDAYWQIGLDESSKPLTAFTVPGRPLYQFVFFLHCDASDYGIGAVLVQLDAEGEEKPIAYMSKKLNAAQRNYSVTERECLAAMEAIKKFRCYLEMQEFEVVTDHSSLLWLMKQLDLSGRLARWVFKLQPYKFTISHRKGKEHIVPDVLSRIPVDEINSLEIVEPEIDINSPF